MFRDGLLSKPSKSMFSEDLINHGMAQNGTEEQGGGTCVGQDDVANENFQEHCAAHSFKRIGGRTRCPFRVAVLSMTSFSGMDAHDGNKASKRCT